MGQEIFALTEERAKRIIAYSNLLVKESRILRIKCAHSRQSSQIVKAQHERLLKKLAGEPGTI